MAASIGENASWSASAPARDQNANAARASRESDRLCAGRYFQAAPDRNPPTRCIARCRRSKFCRSAPITCNRSQLPTPSRKPDHIAVYFPGSTIGNFEPHDRAGFSAPGLPTLRTQRRTYHRRRSAKIARDSRSGLQRQRGRDRRVQSQSAR